MSAGPDAFTCNTEIRYAGASICAGLAHTRAIHPHFKPGQSSAVCRHCRQTVVFVVPPIYRNVQTTIPIAGSRGLL